MGNTWNVMRLTQNVPEEGLKKSGIHTWKVRPIVTTSIAKGNEIEDIVGKSKTKMIFLFSCKIWPRNKEWYKCPKIF